MAMPTSASVAAWLREVSTHANSNKSFIPGYNEIVYISNNSIDRPLRFFIRKDDSEAEDSQARAEAALKEAKLSWLNRVDGLWWDPWLIHERKAKAVKEAAAVVRNYGEMDNIPGDVADRLANLINNELIDVNVLEALTRPLVARGDRSSIKKIVKEIRTERKARGNGPVFTAVDEKAEEVVDATTSPASMNPSTELALPYDMHPVE
ncbi:MAG: hypothetical protein Q9194_007197 [Teloschistes cf. exilis]